MLHDVFGVEQRGRRRQVHPPEFTAIEESYPDFAAQWRRDLAAAGHPSQDAPAHAR